MALQAFCAGPAPGDKGLPGHLRTWVQRNRSDLKRRKQRPEQSLRVLEAERVRDGGTEDLERGGRKRSVNVGMRRSVGFLEPAVETIALEGLRTPKQPLLTCKVCSVS